MWLVLGLNYSKRKNCFGVFVVVLYGTLHKSRDYLDSLI